MVFDVEIASNGIVYECGLMEKHNGETSYFTVDIRIPGTGSLLNTQVHNLELHPNSSGDYFFASNNTTVIPEDISALAPKLNEAIASARNNSSANE